MMAEMNASKAVPARQRLRLLFAEDDPADAEFLLVLLRHHGFTLLSRVVATQELFRAELAHGEYDLILADHNLRTWTAMDALQILKESGKEIPLIVVTGSLGDEAAVECIKRGANDYVLKDRLQRLPTAIDRVLHEKALRQEAARLQELIHSAKREWEITFDAVPDPVLLIDSDYRIRRANVAAAALAGAKPAELIGRFCYEVVHDRSEPMLECPHCRLLETGEPQRCDLREPRLDRWFDVSVTPIRNSGAGTARCVHVMRDISERKRAEEGLREQTAYLNALIEKSPLGIIALDREGRVRLLNPAFERLFLYAREELVGAVIDDLISAEGVRAEARNVTERVLAGETLHLTTQRRRKDGKMLDVEFHAVPLIVRGEVVGAYGLYQDITDRKRLERELAQAQKIEAIGRLAGGVAHDFNNLLAVIVGYSELLLEQVDCAHHMHEKLESILRAAEHATRLTRQLLAFGRKQVLEPKIIDLNTVVAELDKLLTPVLGENIRLTIVPGAGLGQVKADPHQLEQVILNLALNARDAMPRGGRLTIETADVELDEAYCGRHVDVLPGPYVRLAVSDTGCGMTAEQLAHIFEPFFTTKALGEGTGLGLPSVYGIVKQSCGHISVYSEPGQGSTFKVYLPRASETVEVEERLGAPPLSPAGSETILLVEDEEAVREVARESLRRYGYTVFEAASPDDAVELVRRHRGPINLLLTDVVMPTISGRELAQRLVALRPELKVLYMSGYADEAIINHGLLERGTAFLQKPFRPMDLARKIREVLAAGAPAD